MRAKQETDAEKEDRRIRAAYLHIFADAIEDKPYKDARRYADEWRFEAMLIELGLAAHDD